MKILHVWDQAGVGGIITKYLNRLGHEAVVVKRKGFDKFGFSKVYKYQEFDGSSISFYIFVLKKAKNYDLVHVHSLYKLVPLLRLLGVPTVLHFHGSEIRNGRDPLVRVAVKSADKVLISTPDLHSYVPEALWMPNPVDTELFHNCSSKSNAGLAFNRFLDPEKARRYAKKYGFTLTIVERNISYRDMPKLFSKYEYFVDKTEIPSLSRTGLEALACGLKVVRWDGKLIEGLPEEHKPENVVGKIVEIYKEIL